MVSDYFYVIAIAVAVVIGLILRVKVKKITLEENEDRVYWREEGKIWGFEFKLGKIIYLPCEVIVQDSEGGEVFKSTIVNVVVKGGPFRQGGWVLTSPDAPNGVHVLMRPYGSRGFFSPFAERSSEQRLLTMLKKK